MGWSYVLVLLTLGAASSQALVCDSPSYLFKAPGDVMLAAIIGAHSGDDCSFVNYKGLQLVQSVITAIEAVRANNIIPGLTLGLSVYDSCSDDETVQKSIISALVDAECNNTRFLGVLIEEGVEAGIRNLSSGLGVSTFTLSQAVAPSLRAEVVARSLLGLRWLPVDTLFFTSDEELTEGFIESASLLGICIKKKLPLADLGKMKATDTAVIFSDSSEPHDRSSHLNGGKVLFVPLDGAYTEITDNRFSKYFLMLPATIENQFLLNLLNISSEKAIDSGHALPRTKSLASLQLVQVTSDILKLVSLLKTHIQSYCNIASGWSLCPNLPKFPVKYLTSTLLTSIDSIRSNLKFLRMNEDDFESAVILDTRMKNQIIGAVKLSRKGFYLDSEINITEETNICKNLPTNDSIGYDCSECLNFINVYKDYFEQKNSILNVLGLKQEAWVAALLSISTVGVICCIAVTTFIIVRICKKDMLEGNPGFSFILLFSIMLMYCSILPYSFEISGEHQYYSGIFCGLKIFGTSLSYSLVFSIMLARSFMLASCDEDGGFMSHVNGYLQTVLCFFIAAVQIALTLQFWAINWLLLSEEQCLSMSKGPLFLFILGYDMFLLLLLLSISPFILRSKRNYHEGCYFAVSSYVCLCVWCAWCTGYVLLPKWGDVFVCCGLVATATVILVTVFIPRTYLMLTGIVRDHIVSTLPSLNHTTSTSVVDMNYRSSGALYDSVTLPRGGSSNYYADRPNTPSTSKVDEEVVRVENTYERYERSPSPRNITRF